MKIIIENANIVDAVSTSDESAKFDDQLNMTENKTLYIKGDRFSEPFEPDSQTKVIDAAGKTVIPGLCDIHVHFRDPGLTHKEDIQTGCLAAARGGFTTVCCMPNTKPAIDNLDTLMYVDSANYRIANENSGMRNTGLVNVFATSAMTIGQAGKKLCDFHSLDRAATICHEMTGHGVAAITEDGMTLHNDELMDEICQIAKKLDLVIMDHAEPEIEMVKRDIELSRKNKCKMHIQHISKAESVDLIRIAKADGVSITAEAAPHHFFLNGEDIKKYGVNAKMNPPLANEKDRIAVVNGILDGTIDIIATDHAPHTEEEKNVEFDDAPNGIIGLETAFPVAYTTFVKSGLMSFEALVEKMSVNPLKLIGMPPVGFNVGEIADLAIVDIDNEYEINKEKFASKARNTPFHGMKVYGRVETTIHDGEISWEIDKYVTSR